MVAARTIDILLFNGGGGGGNSEILTAAAPNEVCSDCMTASMTPFS